MLKQGWLDRQIEKASEDIKTWPSWMRREGKIDDSEGNRSCANTNTKRDQKPSPKR